MEITDFAAALRGMADNADKLAERHDVLEIAGLRRAVDDQAAKISRDQDLIDELRRQLAAVTRYVDGIARMRRTIVPGDTEAVLAEALMLIAGDRCSSFTSGSCRSATSGKTRGAPYMAEAWCDECIARDALERAGVGIEDGETK